MSRKTGTKASDKTIGPETCNVDDVNIVTGTRERKAVPRSAIMGEDVSSDEEDEFEEDKEDEVEVPPPRRRITNRSPMSVIQDNTAGDEDEDEEFEPLPVSSGGPKKKNVSSVNIATRKKRASESNVILISSDDDEEEARPPKNAPKTFESHVEPTIKEPKRRVLRTSIISHSIDDKISDAPPEFGRNTFGIHKNKLVAGPRKRNSESVGLTQSTKSKKGGIEQGLTSKPDHKTSDSSSERTTAVSTRRKSEFGGLAPKAVARSEAKTKNFPSTLDSNTVSDFSNVSTASRMQTSRSGWPAPKAGDSSALIGNSFSKISLENVTGGKRRRNLESYAAYGGGSLISSEDEDEGILGLRGTGVQGQDIQPHQPPYIPLGTRATNTISPGMAGPETRRNNLPSIPLETDKTYTSPSWPDTVYLNEHRTRRGLIVGWHIQYPQQRDGLRIEARLDTAKIEIYFLPIAPGRENPLKGEINGLLKRIRDGGQVVDPSDVLLDPQLFPRFEYEELQTLGGEKREEAMGRLLDIFMEREGL
ncbi:hypothetical protein HYFRA_00001169 [Hymenoscyphus fraxineus]|uniref:Uncharacterized protein n=1 Tax=Hymenoscyphus fraxineus TaxID=746836 RepID=A0A9N9KVT0_9HELO|nr:hypothetical protein HYFRA_00001169 [Hymenoscyphus fraxineus]